MGPSSLPGSATCDQNPPGSCPEQEQPPHPGSFPWNRGLTMNLILGTSVRDPMDPETPPGITESHQIDCAC